MLIVYHCYGIGVHRYIMKLFKIIKKNNYFIREIVFIKTLKCNK